MSLYHEEFFAKPQCCNCRQEIPGVGIECLECHNGNFKICYECFTYGAEIGQHKRDHPYRFFDSGSLSLFPASAEEEASTKENNGSSRWTAKEEIRILDAIEQYGFGNWQDISKHIETKGATEAKEEFVRRYVVGNIGKFSWADRTSGRDFRNGVFPQPIDHTIPCDDGPLSPSLTSRLPPLDISADEMLQLGYMPFRDDYEKEYDNDAEKLVAQLSFSPEDDELDMGLKLALVDIYSRRLRERARRKRVIRDYQLVCKFFKKDRVKAAGGGITNGDVGTETEETLKKFVGWEKLHQEKLKPFAQFYNSREFDQLIRNLTKERELKMRLQELLKYRAAGITRVADCIEYERIRAGPGIRGKRTFEAVDEEDDECRSHKKAMIPSPVLIQQLLQPSIKESSNSNQIVCHISEGSVEESASVTQSLTHLLFSKDVFSSKNLESSESDRALFPQILEEMMGKASQQTTPLEESLYLQNEKLKDTVAQYTANLIPSADLLSSLELKFCKRIQLLPSQFLTFKMASLVGRLNTEYNNGVQTDENSYVGRPITMDKGHWVEMLKMFGNSIDEPALT